ncbi:hypothetical protein ATO6_07505 [Oceanicola sp. 22II-s10i]|uniref:hypothetical protein n=1 Tax=Oceanicola sp. 22II-s10i TaxID=1317116 RepID=UPI000B526116|nr:hypothetical protein [Oceanicola sp. 22II-s10i]OWU86617.1 hypothetical protein ATO6_07505 [Oceanicola sp. 22II-s10i]
MIALTQLLELAFLAAALLALPLAARAGWRNRPRGLMTALAAVTALALAAGGLLAWLIFTDAYPQATGMEALALVILAAIWAGSCLLASLAFLLARRIGARRR